MLHTSSVLRYDLNEALQRPIIKHGDVCGGEFAQPELKGLLETSEFLRVFQTGFGVAVPRRTLQLYTSPGLKLMPLPIHKGGFKSYYLHPEHVNWLGVIVHLQSRHLPLREIRAIMHKVPERYHRFITSDILWGEEALHAAVLVDQGFQIRDIIYRKACDLLDSIDRPSGKAVAKFEYIARGTQILMPGGDVRGKKDEFIDKALAQEASRLADWIKKGNRRRVESALGSEGFERLLKLGQYKKSK